MDKVITVLCAIIEQQNRILVTQRSHTMAQALLWEFPGGKQEAGEAEEECLVREIKEELNLTVRPIKRLTPSRYDYGDKIILLVPYQCDYVKGAIQLQEHRAYQWATLQELLSYTWCPADIPVVEELIRLKKEEVSSISPSGE